METLTLRSEPRSAMGSRAAGRIRESGRMPAVIYGHGEPVETVSLSQHDVEVALVHGQRTLDVDINGTAKQYLIKEVQYDHLGQTPIHLDLVRVALDERVTVHVAIEPRGVPKGVAEGGMLEQIMTEIEVECLVTEIPDTLHPMVTELQVGEALLVKDIIFPPGVKPLADPEEWVLTVRAMAAAPAAEEAVGEVSEGIAEPERIGRARKDEGADEGD